MTTDDQTRPTEPDDMKHIRREDELKSLGASPDTPWEIATVDGCDCGGIDVHRAASGNVFGYGCTIWDLPRPARDTRIEAAKDRIRNWIEDPPDIPDYQHKQPCDCHEQLLSKLDRAIEVLEEIRDARRGKNARLDRRNPNLCKLCQIHDFIGIYCMGDGDHGKCDDVCKYCSQPCHCECHKVITAEQVRP